MVNTRRRGILLLDTLMALTVLGILAGVLVVVAGDHLRTCKALDDGLAATLRAESALDQLQAGQTPADVRVTTLPDVSPVPGKIWVRVQATVDGRTESLVGLVPGGPP